MYPSNRTETIYECDRWSNVPSSLVEKWKDIVSGHRPILRNMLYTPCTYASGAFPSCIAAAWHSGGPFLFVNYLSEWQAVFYPRDIVLPFYRMIPDSSQNSSLCNYVFSYIGTVVDLERKRAKLHRTLTLDGESNRFTCTVLTLDLGVIALKHRSFIPRLLSTKQVFWNLQGAYQVFARVDVS